MQLLIIKDHNGTVKIQQALAEDEFTDNVEELFDNRMKEAGWNFTENYKRKATFC